MQDDSAKSSSEFWVGEQVHLTNNPRRIGTVKYVGPIEGHAGEWVGVNWDTGEAKRVGRRWDGGLGEMGWRSGTAMKMNPEQIGKAESRWGREKKIEKEKGRKKRSWREKKKERGEKFNIFLVVEYIILL